MDDLGVPLFSEPPIYLYCKSCLSIIFHPPLWLSPAPGNLWGSRRNCPSTPSEISCRGVSMGRKSLVILTSSKFFSKFVLFACCCDMLLYAVILLLLSLRVVLYWVSFLKFYIGPDPHTYTLENGEMTEAREPTVKVGCLHAELQSVCILFVCTCMHTHHHMWPGFEEREGGNFFVELWEQIVSDKFVTTGDQFWCSPSDQGAEVRQMFRFVIRACRGDVAFPWQPIEFGLMGNLLDSDPFLP